MFLMATWRGYHAQSITEHHFPSHRAISRADAVGPTFRFGRLSASAVRTRGDYALTGVVTVRPSGPLGALIVRLKPEAAARLVGDRMQEFVNKKMIWMIFLMRAKCRCWRRC
jgi:hypothetical protein